MHARPPDKTMYTHRNGFQIVAVAVSLALRQHIVAKQPVTNNVTGPGLRWDRVFRIDEQVGVLCG